MLFPPRSYGRRKHDEAPQRDAHHDSERAVEAAARAALERHRHGIHLGYRKGRHGGTWLVRWRHQGGYRQVPLGVADDKVSEGTLTYDAAYRAAREHVEAVRKEARAAAEGPVLTVRQAVEAYIAERDARESRRKGRPVHSDAHRLERYVIGRERQGKRKAIAPAKLADVPLHELNEDHLLKWRASLPDTTAASQKQRTVNDLKAALNLHMRRTAASDHQARAQGDE
jgi:hypothetical protein